MTKCYKVVDLETTINNVGPTAIGKNKASPYHPDNKVVMAGELLITETGDRSILTRDGRHSIAASTYLLVGHNFKFDMSYAFVVGSFIDGVPMRDWLTEGYIWDTQTAEYILSGQEKKFPSLDQCSATYGGTLKDDRLSVMWKAGVPTEEFMPEMLEEYLVHDLENTNLVFTKQMEAARKQGQLALIRSMNKANVAYTEMEVNGMAVDVTLANEMAADLELSTTIYEGRLRHALPDELKGRENPDDPNSDYIINLSSPQQLSVLLFGGTLTYREREKVGVYKNGKDKYKYVDKEWEDPLYSFVAKPEWRTKKYEVFKTSDDVLRDVLLNQAKDRESQSFIETIITLRGQIKELSGYYKPIPKLVTADNILHQNINNCLTKTGRLSMSNPNLQNVASGGESRVKELFVSRFKDGQIIDADYKQLEVIALAYLSQDPQLIDDIINGVDIHGVTHNKVRHLLDAAGVHKDSQRRKVKGVNFALIYGGGAATISKTVGLAKPVVEAIISAFYDRYPDILTWQDTNYEYVTKHRQRTGFKTAEGFPRGKSYLPSVTGRRYSFLEYDAPDWVRARDHIDTSFSPTEVKNYPVQGLATGDIVPMIVGELYRALVGDDRLKDKCLMINTVHDSIIFDCQQEVLDEAIELIQSVMEDAPRLLEEVFGITDFYLPLKVDITHGENWKEQITS